MSEAHPGKAAKEAIESPGSPAAKAELTACQGEEVIDQGLDLFFQGGFDPRHGSLVLLAKAISGGEEVIDPPHFLGQ